MDDEDKWDFEIDDSGALKASKEKTTDMGLWKAIPYVLIGGSLFLALAALLIGSSYLWGGFVLSKMVAWFFPWFTVSWLQATGVYVTLLWITNIGATRNSDDDSNALWQFCGRYYFGPALVLFIGWIITLFV